MKSKLLLIALIMLGICSSCQKEGKHLVEFPEFESENIGNRRVEIYLPEDYYENNEKKYAVLYMHDGQNVFHDSLSYLGSSWQAHTTAQSLMNENTTKPFIIVAINNANEKRWQEYAPNKVIEELKRDYPEKMMPEEYNHLPILSDKYLAFLVTELKPYIDEHYKVLSDRENTAIMGSSMGGLISLYAVCEYPTVFGSAACISTHWNVHKGKGMEGVRSYIKYLKVHFPNIYQPRLYFDHGTVNLDESYSQKQIVIDRFFKKKGYEDGVNYRSRVFTGADHNEMDWAKRLSVPLTFLFQK